MKHILKTSILLTTMTLISGISAPLVIGLERKENPPSITKASQNKTIEINREIDSQIGREINSRIDTQVNQNCINSTKVHLAMETNTNQDRRNIETSSLNKVSSMEFSQIITTHSPLKDNNSKDKKSKNKGLPLYRIVNKLNEIPVFIIANKSGKALAERTINNTSIIRVFMSQKDADACMGIVQSITPKLAKKLKVKIVRLGDIYKKMQSDEAKEKKWIVQFVPVKEQLAFAKKIWNIYTLEKEEFKGVPLFLATIQRENKTEYLLYKQNGKDVIPLFFEKNDLYRFTSIYIRENNDNDIDKIRVNIISLEKILSTFEKEDNKTLRQMIFVPSEETIEVMVDEFKRRRNSFR